MAPQVQYIGFIGPRRPTFKRGSMPVKEKVPSALKKAAVAALVAFFAGLGITNAEPLLDAVTAIITQVQSEPVEVK